MSISSHARQIIDFKVTGAYLAGIDSDDAGIPKKAGKTNYVFKERIKICLHGLI